jgi:hypothetical protein
MLGLNGMDGISSISASLYSGLNASASSSSAGASTSGSAASVSTADGASLELQVLQQQGQAVSTLLGGLGGSSSSVFAGASALSLLNAQGSPAMAYFSPQSAAGRHVNAVG